MVVLKPGISPVMLAPGGGRCDEAQRICVAWSRISSNPVRDGLTELKGNFFREVSSKLSCMCLVSKQL